MEEVWKDVKGYEGLYQISNLGRMKSLKRYVVRKKQGNFYTKEKIRSVPTNLFGYKETSITKNGKIKRIKIHRLVAQAFIPNPLNKKEINHKDGNKTNNNVNNLEWCTRSENIKHAYDTGLKTPKYGEQNHLTKFTDLEAKEIRKLYGVKPMKEICEKFNISRWQVRKIGKGIARQKKGN